MSKFFEAYPHDFGLLCIENEGTKFGFCCGGSDELEDRAGDVDSAIDEDWVAVTWNSAKEEIAPSATLCLQGAMIGSIGMDVEDHVGCAGLNFGIGICHHIIKKLVDASVGLFCGVGFLVGNCRKCHENSWVDNACMILYLPTICWMRFLLAASSRGLSSCSVGAKLSFPYEIGFRVWGSAVALPVLGVHIGQVTAEHTWTCQYPPTAVHNSNRG
jgi:hypothetical protein